jgi:hypothetical protein
MAVAVAKAVKRGLGLQPDPEGTSGFLQAGASAGASRQGNRGRHYFNMTPRRLWPTII